MGTDNKDYKSNICIRHDINVGSDVALGSLRAGKTECAKKSEDNQFLYKSYNLNLCTMHFIIKGEKKMNIRAFLFLINLFCERKPNQYNRLKEIEQTRHFLLSGN